MPKLCSIASKGVLSSHAISTIRDNSSTENCSFKLAKGFSYLELIQYLYEIGRYLYQSKQ
jgi:hypothetical protein